MSRWDASLKTGNLRDQHRENVVVVHVVIVMIILVSGHFYRGVSRRSYRKVFEVSTIRGTSKLHLAKGVE